MEIKRLKGTYDILPGRIEEWQYVENVAKIFLINTILKKCVFLL